MTRREFTLGLAAAGLTSQLPAVGRWPKLDLGLELYSLRADMKRDVPGTLARVREMGFHHVEVPSLYGLSAPDFRRALNKEGLKATAMVAPYDDLKNNMAGVESSLGALGARWALLPWIPHGDKFERADVERASRDMNAWGAALTEAGYKFAYHLHGYEFQPALEGTLFDALAKATDADAVKFELDTFWIVWPGQDCVVLLRRYPSRFRLLHLKDLRKGVKTGDLHGQAPEADSVAVGEGLVPWKALLDVAREQQVDGYYIEDESPDAAQQIPRSLEYLRRINVI